MLFREFNRYTDKQSLLKLHLSTVRPHLEYASSVWDPHLKKDIEAIERVPKFGLKVCLEDWNSSYSNLPKHCTLASRRHQFIEARGGWQLGSRPGPPPGGLAVNSNFYLTHQLPEEFLHIYLTSIISATLSQPFGS